MSAIKVLFFIALALPCLDHVSTQAQTFEAHNVWDRVLAAKGGREQLRSVGCLAWSSDDPRKTSRGFGGVRYEFVECYPDRFWDWEDYRPGSLGFGVQVRNTTKRLDWFANKGGPATPIPWRSDAANARMRQAREHQLAFLVESAVLRPVPKRIVRVGGGYAIDLEVPGFTNATLTVDATTYLPTSVVVIPDLGELAGAAKAPASEYHLDGYTDVGGLKMPTRIKELGILTFIINPRVDPKLFETPPDGVKSRDHWKQYLVK